MTSSSKDRYYSTVGKSRRTSQGDSQPGGFFSTGQGGRTILPPLSDSFPTSRFPGRSSQFYVVDHVAQTDPSLHTVPSSYSNPYTQPRSAPNKLGYDLDAQLYGGYQASNASQYRSCLSSSLNPLISFISP